MDYARFVRLRTPAWEDFGARLTAAQARPVAVSHADLEALALAYRQILHDHGLATARFPRSGAARRLGTLALAGTHWLHAGSGDGPSRGGFFARRFPRAFRAHLPYLAASVALFLVAFAFGSAVAIVRPAAGTALLGPDAVDGLRRGHLWTESLVTTVPPAVSSSGIATNNMSVAITAWAGGALLGLGALYIVLFNGFMLGVVLATTLHYGLASALLTFVSAHGPLEITLILVTAAGGLGLGHALVAADDRPRSVVLGESSREALVLLLGCLPWFVVLAIIEGVVSPAPAVPPALKVALGFGLLALFLTLAWNPKMQQPVR